MESTGLDMLMLLQGFLEGRVYYCVDAEDEAGMPVIGVTNAETATDEERTGGLPLSVPTRVAG